MDEKIQKPEGDGDFSRSQAGDDGGNAESWQGGDHEKKGLYAIELLINRTIFLF